MALTRTGVRWNSARSASSNPSACGGGRPREARRVGVMMLRAHLQPNPTRPPHFVRRSTSPCRGGIESLLHRSRTNQNHCDEPLLHAYWRIDDDIVFSVATMELLALGKVPDGLIERLS